MVELGIVDIREIIRLIRTHFGFDFSNFALTSLKYRLEHIIAKNNLSSPEGLYRKLIDQKDFFDTFLFQLMVPSTEMFRDPSVWRWIREEYFSKLEDLSLMNYKIWLPFSTSGGELYSIAILLKELNLTHRVKLFASVLSDASVQYIKTGEYPPKKIEVSIENYNRFQGDHDFEKRYCDEKYTINRNASLLDNVEFIKDDLELKNAPKNVKLILMRNSMIYFNPTYQDFVINKMYDSLSANGIFIIGLKETLGSKPNLFETVNENEGVYRKRI